MKDSGDCKDNGKNFECSASLVGSNSASIDKTIESLLTNKFDSRIKSSDMWKIPTPR